MRLTYSIKRVRATCADCGAIDDQARMYSVHRTEATTVEAWPPWKQIIVCEACWNGICTRKPSVTTGLYSPERAVHETLMITSPRIALGAILIVGSVVWPCLSITQLTRTADSYSRRISCRFVVTVQGIWTRPLETDAVLKYQDSDGIRQVRAHITEMTTAVRGPRPHEQTTTVTLETLP